MAKGKATIVTKEINTHPNAKERIGGNSLTKGKVLGNLLPYGYACEIGTEHYFPGHIHDYFVRLKLVE